jgi:hypothetical protein
MKKYLATFLLWLTLSILNGGVANSFEFKLDGWREFKFGQTWSSAEKLLNNYCLRLEVWGTREFNDLNGLRCGEWLGLEVNVRIISDEGGFFGSGRKLEDIYISTPYSENAENKILNFLNQHFELSNDYGCWGKNVHWCTKSFNKGTVKLEDKFRRGKRQLTVQLHSREIFK